MFITLVMPAKKLGVKLVPEILMRLNGVLKVKILPVCVMLDAIQTKHAT